MGFTHFQYDDDGHSRRLRFSNDVLNTVQSLYLRAEVAVVLIDLDALAVGIG